ncbi:unnamed protein product [Heligmosomoides polygyrus]|uniref:MFS domain-containing protein n=1 Tax=Heligmosomoides polygyrus TaxID=6339 RepID=A0A3P7WVP4_HELPZ|nr:unnamed protein product [Heligmosomoides polygyrus]
MTLSGATTAETTTTLQDVDGQMTTDASCDAIVGVSETQPLLDNEEPSTTKATFSSFTAREWSILVMLALANFWSVVAFSCIAPFYPMEAAKKGLTEFEIGITFGIFELVIFLVSPIVGKLMPRFGPKNFFTIGCASTGLIAMSFGFVDLIPTRRAFFIASLTIRCLQGGILQTCGGIGFSMGPFLGGLLYNIGGFRLPFYCLSVIFFVIAVISRWLIPNDQGLSTEAHSTTGYRQLLRNPTIWLMMFALFNTALSSSFINPSLAGHLASFHLSPPVLGLVFLLSGVCYSITAPLNGMVVDRYKCHRAAMLVAPVAIIIALTMTGPSPLLPLSKNLAVIVVGQVIFGAGLSTLQIPTYRNTLDAAKEQGFEDGTATYGLISGLIEATYSMGAFIGPTAGGFIEQYYGFAWTITVISGFHLCFLVVYSTVYVYKRCRTKSLDDDELNV